MTITHELEKVIAVFHALLSILIFDAKVRRGFLIPVFAMVLGSFSYIVSKI